MNSFLIRSMALFALLSGMLSVASGPAPAALAQAGGGPEPGAAALMTAEAPPEPGPGVGPVVRINSADEAALRTLHGVGPSRARAILRYRRLRGPFRGEQDLLKVRGISERLLQRNRGRLRWD